MVVHFRHFERDGEYCGNGKRNNLNVLLMHLAYKIVSPELYTRTLGILSLFQSSVFLADEERFQELSRPLFL